MLKLCLSIAWSIATSIAWAQVAAAGFSQNQPPEPPERLQRCVVERMMVDGLAVVEHQWCAWTGDRWVPLMSDEGQFSVFGIKPVLPGTIPAPSIPKNQRRME